MGIQKRTPDLIGQKFGKLTVLSCAGSNKFNKAVWECECECGKHTFPTTGELNSGRRKSCGCYTKEIISKTKKRYNTYDLTGDYGIGYDSNNKEFYFDLEDYDKIKNYCWLVDDKYGYVDCKNDHCRLHRLIMNCTDSNLDIDHINHQCNDNRKINLRITTSSQNQMNRTRTRNKATNSSLGIAYHTRDHRWQAYITIDGHNKYLGYYGTKEEAEAARHKAEDEYQKEYSYRNSINLVNRIGDK